MKPSRSIRIARKLICGIISIFIFVNVTWAGFIDNGNGTVTDTITGLIWQKNESTATLTWENSLSYCNNLSLSDETDWRLPDIRELQSIINDNRYMPALDNVFLVNNTAGRRWSSSSLNDRPSLAWTVNIASGGAIKDYKYNSAFVRCVRGGEFVRVVNSTKEPSSNLITLPLNGQLKNLRQAPVYSDKPTVVITHGWNLTGTNEIPSWIVEMSQAMIDGSVDANLLWWDWMEQASSLTPASSGKAASNAPRQGTALANGLSTTFGESYNQTIHFIGHSMGNRVNRQAVNDLHSNGWDPSKTHVTLLDAAEDAALYGELDPNPWDKCIPDNAFWIDNYVTAFGNLHQEAANVILKQGMPFTFAPTLVGIVDSLVDFHHYAIDWYIASIRDPSLSQMGFRWSFEGGGLNGSPVTGSTYRQTSTLLDSELNLENITWDEAVGDIWGRNALFAIQPGFLPVNLIHGPIEIIGNVRAGLSNIFQNSIQHMLNLTLTEGSPSYAWVPIYIPTGSEFMSFKFNVEQPGDGDFLSVGIQDELLFMLEIDNSNVQQIANSGYLNISEYAGNEVDLFFGLNSVGNPNAKISIDNITFYSRLFGETDNDGDVDGTDLAVMINSFGSVAGQPNFNPLIDLNGDGVVDQYDMIKFSEKFGHVN
jgi:hypothetical protein